MPRGRAFKGHLPYIGENIHYRPLKEKGQAKLDVSWEDGIYLGVMERSLEIIVGDLKGHVVKCRDMKRKVETG